MVRKKKDQCSIDMELLKAVAFPLEGEAGQNSRMN